MNPKQQAGIVYGILIMALCFTVFIVITGIRADEDNHSVAIYVESSDETERRMAEMYRRDSDTWKLLEMEMHPTELGADWRDYRFSVNGNIYQVGAPLYVFLDAGWEPSFSPDMIVKRNGWLLFIAEPATLTHPDVPGISCSVKLYNESDFCEMAARYCNVATITFHMEDSTQNSLRLSGDVMLGQHKNEVKALWGDPAEELNRSLSYYDEKPSFDTGGGNMIPRHSYITLNCDKAGVVTEVMISSLEVHGWGNYFGEPLNGASVQAILNSYRPPAELGENAEDNIYRLNGDVYRLPTPLMEYYANGWMLRDAETGPLVLPSKSTYGYILVRNEGEELLLTVSNLAGCAATPDHCMVTMVSTGNFIEESGYISSHKPSLELPRGVAVGCTEELVRQVIPGYDPQLGVYKVGPNNIDYRFIVKDGKVIGIKLSMSTQRYKPNTESE